MASHQYDANQHLTQATDRKGQVTSYQYDALDRRTRVTYADASTIDYTYDLGDRLTQIVDSLNGTITPHIRPAGSPDVCPRPLETSRVRSLGSAFGNAWEAYD
jgi:YD repeat-containing protein